MIVAGISVTRGCNGICRCGISPTKSTTFTTKFKCARKDWMKDEKNSFIGIKLLSIPYITFFKT